ncbi:hypothetical protein [Agrobacterium rosae]|uniref:hypothetical protein n=1 Tax=Agrobacterium rosae TaxID=1972867 RepID=UPI00203374F4|nr:hypothetical protein [Agrobacterium rosae]MCM2435383.1 hypothetical protein [Agrobacterium rosae]
MKLMSYTRVMKVIDKAVGKSLRALVNVLTGNYFVRMEKRISLNIKNLEDRVRESNDINGQIRDALERDVLEMYKRANRQ